MYLKNLQNNPDIFTILKKLVAKIHFHEAITQYYNTLDWVDLVHMDLTKFHSQTQIIDDMFPIPFSEKLRESSEQNLYLVYVVRRLNQSFLGADYDVRAFQTVNNHALS